MTTSDPVPPIVPAGIGPTTVQAPPRSVGELNGELATLLAGLLDVDFVPERSHFFEELGADSLVMAHFCARVRKRQDLPSISIKDVYAHPSIAELAAALAASAPAASATVAGPEVTAEGSAEETAVAGSTRDFVLCGVLQTLCFLTYCYLVSVAASAGYAWILSASGYATIYLRAVVLSAVGFVAVASLPIVAKWALIGRWRQQTVRIWSLGYVRFWIVKTLLRLNPAALLVVGSPLYSVYLRALGAKVGPGAVVFSRRLPVCTDLITIGAGAVIRREATFFGYRARAGSIETGRVTLGRDAYVGERSVLDIDTSLGDRSQLGHSSALHSGQAIPAGQSWHGSPAEPGEVDYVRVPALPCGRWRRIRYSIGSLLGLFFVVLPLVGAGLDLLVSPPASLKAVVVSALLLSLTLFLGLAALALLVVCTLPRVLNLFLEPGRVYPLFGFHDRVHRTIARMTTLKFFMHLFGDSSYVVGYLRALGYRLTPVEQTGSNFGIEVKHANPFLSSVGTGTMVADGLVMINDDVSSSSFRVSPTSLGRHNFVGNDVNFPAGGRTGENCLLATKVMVPLDGEVREGQGLLGSPPFAIPRSVDRDSRFDHLRTGAELRTRLRAKNRHNLRTIGLFLATRWCGFFLVVLLDLLALDLHGQLGHVLMASLFALSLVVSVVFYALTDRVFAGFRSLRPTYCSIYDPYFWLHERLWKIPAMEQFHLFDGTPFKPQIWRLMGVHVGRRVFDDGVHISERTLTILGDDCVLNARSKIQCHSQEDGTFKTDRTTIGKGASVGVAALVHYGVTLGDYADLAADSFLMKGEDVPEHARWGGNPAGEL